MKGKIALVTGSGRGIGKAIAIGLAREGLDIVVTDIDLDSAKATAAEVMDLGEKSMAIRCDVSDYDEVKQMVDKVVAEWGGIDVLVNNAGVAVSKMWEDLEKSDWDRVIRINLGSVLNCSKAVLETMKKRGGGSIISMASMSAKSISDAASPDYTATKAAIIGLTRQLAYELGPHNIRVNAICPGTVKTPLTEMSPKLVEKFGSLTPLRRLVEPEEIAYAIAFLVSEKALMITGSTIDIDGGQRLGFLDRETYIAIRKGTFK